MIHEQLERPDQIRGMFDEICCGNQDAVHTCWAVFQFLHVIDDLYDRDHVVSIDTVGLALLGFTESIAANPFFQANRDILLGQLRVSVLEWVDSEKWRTREDIREKLAAEVLKSQYQNFFYLIASLCGGLHHMAAVTQKYRQYHWD